MPPTPSLPLEVSGMVTTQPLPRVLLLYMLCRRRLDGEIRALEKELQDKAGYTGGGRGVGGGEGRERASGVRRDLNGFLYCVRFARSGCSLRG